MRPLYHAADQGSLNMVQLLLDGSANVNAGRRSDGATPLVVAAGRGQLDHTSSVPAKPNN